MTDGSSYELVLTPPAVRGIRWGRPEAVAAAVIEFLTVALVTCTAPTEVAKPHGCSGDSRPAFHRRVNQRRPAHACERHVLDRLASTRFRCGL